MELLPVDEKRLVNPLHIVAARKEFLESRLTGEMVCTITLEMTNGPFPMHVSGKDAERLWENLLMFVPNIAWRKVDEE